MFAYSSNVRFRALVKFVSTKKEEESQFGGMEQGIDQV